MSKTKTDSTYTVGNASVSEIVYWLDHDEIGIPELQRPYVWPMKKIHQLIEALYHGRPIGFILTWEQPNVLMRGGKMSGGRRILIDGQQRIKSLDCVIRDQGIVTQTYKAINPKIAFNPIKKDKQFVICGPRHRNDSKWIDDVGPIIYEPTLQSDWIDDYMKKNKNANKKVVKDAIYKLSTIGQKRLGLITILGNTPALDVAQIFIDINSLGTKLKKVDYVGAIISSTTTDMRGSNLRKCIDNFCWLLHEPSGYKKIALDKQFDKAGLLKKIAWASDKRFKPIYKPDYEDVLRVVGLLKFKILDLNELLQLLAGWNSAKRMYEQTKKLDTLKHLENGVEDFSHEYNFTGFEQILKDVGFMDYSVLMSNKGSSLNFVYAIYLSLRKKLARGILEKIVGKWFVMSLLTSRYSGKGYQNLLADLKYVEKDKIEKRLADIEKETLHKKFWEKDLVNRLDRYTSWDNDSTLAVFYAAMIKDADDGFLSRNTKTLQLFIDKGDKHHIFPKDFLIKKRFPKNSYNQFANLIPATTEINRYISNKPPKQYMTEVTKQFKKKKGGFSGIIDDNSLKKNLKMNCIPSDLGSMTEKDFDRFLVQRRKLMAEKIEKYYKDL